MQHVIERLRESENAAAADRQRLEDLYQETVRAVAHDRDVDPDALALLTRDLGKSSKDVAQDIADARELIELRGLAAQIPELDQQVVLAYEAHQAVLRRIQEQWIQNQEDSRAAREAESTARQQHARAVAARERLKQRGLWSE